MFGHNPGTSQWLLITTQGLLSDFSSQSQRPNDSWCSQDSQTIPTASLSLLSPVPRHPNILLLLPKLLLPLLLPSLTFSSHMFILQLWVGPAKATTSVHSRPLTPASSSSSPSPSSPRPLSLSSWPSNCWPDPPPDPLDQWPSDPLTKCSLCDLLGVRSDGRSG